MTNTGINVLTMPRSGAIIGNENLSHLRIKLPVLVIVNIIVMIAVIQDWSSLESFIHDM